MTPEQLDDGERLLAARTDSQDLWAAWRLWAASNAEALVAGCRERDALKAGTIYVDWSKAMSDLGKLTGERDALKAKVTHCEKRHRCTDCAHTLAEVGRLRGEVSRAKKKRANTMAEVEVRTENARRFRAERGKARRACEGMSRWNDKLTAENKRLKSERADLVKRVRREIAVRDAVQAAGVGEDARGREALTWILGLLGEGA